MPAALKALVPALLPEAWHPLCRLFALATVLIAAAYVLNNFLIHVEDQTRLLDGGVLTTAIYGGALALALWLTYFWRDRPLDRIASTLSDANTTLIRGAFWAVVLVGSVDAVISLLRIEDLAPAVFGDDLANEMKRQHFRGPYIHFPLILIGFALAFVTRGLGFIWLSLLVVFAQLTIVIMVNVYSYEQAFLSDLVRFWYAALFLFATAHTLLAGGHVRVDVVFANLPQRRKNWANFWGALVLGLPLAWVTLVAGTWDKTRIINAPILNYEIGQQSVGGLYVKYLMAGFLLILAVTLIVQFTALLLSAISDQGREETEGASA